MVNATFRIIILGILISCVFIQLQVSKRSREGFQTAPSTVKVSDPNNPYFALFNPLSLDVLGNPSPYKKTNPPDPPKKIGTPTREDLIEAEIINAYSQYTTDNNFILETDQVESVEEELPDFGAMLTAQDVDQIPPDYDNKDMMPSDYLWGVIPQEASEMLFTKAYVKAQMQGLTGVVWDDNSQSFFQHSPLFQVNTGNENTAKLIQIGEVLAFTAAGNFLGSKQKNVEDIKKTASAPGKPARSLGKNMVKLDSKVGKVAGKKFGKKIGARVGSKMAARIIKKISAAMARASAQSAAVPIGPFITGTLMIIYATLLIITNEILAKVSDELGCCPVGQDKLDRIIPDWANEIIGLIDGVGDVLNAFYPYACVNGKDIKLKATLPTPGFLDDPSLSSQLRTKGVEQSCDNRPPASIDALGQCVTDFSSTIILDSMAQFYQDQSLLYSIKSIEYDENGNSFRTQSFITRFYAVRASSERSCDVIADFIEVRQDPVTGENYQSRYLGRESRRFYFALGKGSGGTDSVDNTQVVTGCTNIDHTGTDIEDTDTDPKTGNEKCITLPKKFQQKSSRNDGPFFNRPSLVGMMNLGVQVLAGPKVQVGSQVASITSGQDMSTGLINTKTSDEEFQQGPPINQTEGYIPKVVFCRKAKIELDTCMDSTNLRKSIDNFHKAYPRIHVKTVKKIETAGSDACYQEWEEVAQDPATNIESENRVLAKTLYQQAITDTRTCVFSNPTIVRDAGAISQKLSENLKNPLTGELIKQRQIPAPQGSLRNGFQVPRPVPPEMVLGGNKCIPPDISANSILNNNVDYKKVKSNISLSCNNPAFLADLINDYNMENNDSKILKCHLALTPKEDRCDLEVDMQRKIGNKLITSLETLGVELKPKDSSNPCQYVQHKSLGPNSATFIQENTPRGDEISGNTGVLSFMKSMVDSVRKQFGNTILPILNLRAPEKVSEIASNTSKLTDDMYEIVYMNQELEGCPTKKCSDPDILREIMNYYNTLNYPKEQQGVQKETMRSILKAGIANSKSCDILFENLIEFQDDLNNDPVESRSVGRAMRFSLQHQGNCKQTVVPNQEYDVSSNALGLKSPKTLIQPAFRLPETAKLNCNDPALIKPLRQDILNLSSSDTYQKIVASVPSSTETCDQKAIKDTLIYDDETGENIRIEGIDSYLQMSVDQNVASGKYDQKSVKELAIESVETPNGDIAIQVNGVEQDPPYLQGWDPSMQNKKVNTTEIYLSS